MGVHRKLYMFEHRGGWKYKKAVPHDLHSVVGRKAWAKYLGTIARPDAELEARALSLDHDRLIQTLRALSPVEREKIVAAGGVRGYKSDIQIANVAATFIQAGAGRFDPDPDASEDQYAREAAEIFRARHEVAALRAEVAAGKNVLAKLDPKNRALVGLNSLIDVWERVAQPRSVRSIGKMKLYVGRFIETVGDLTPRGVTADHAARFRDALEKRPGISSVTAEKHLHGLHTLFNVARSERIVDSNVFHGVKTRKAGKFTEGIKKKTFEPVQVRTIFDAMAGESEDFQWMVRLLAYHGMRSGEVAQLRCDDVTEMFGVPVLRVHDKFGSLKNKASLRDIPIHPACVGIVCLRENCPRAMAFFVAVEDGRARRQVPTLCQHVPTLEGRHRRQVVDDALTAAHVAHAGA